MRHAHGHVMGAALLVAVGSFVLPAESRDALSQQCWEVVHGPQSTYAACEALARTAKDSGSRLEAVRGIVDQRVLAEIAKTDADQAVRAFAATMVTDEAVLADLARTGDPRVRFVAVNDLTDQATLAEIARTDRDTTIRYAAVSRVTDQAVLTAIAKTDPDIGVRGGARQRRIGGLDAIVTVSTDQGPKMHMGSVRLMTDQTLLAQLAKTANNPLARAAAALRLTDRRQAVELAKSNREAGAAVVEGLSDETLLADIARGATATEVRRLAVNKLTDQRALGEIARADDTWKVRVTAVKRLTDDGALAAIGANDIVPAVRAAARARQSELTGEGAGGHEMLMTPMLAANACGVTWDPVRVLPGGVRSKLESAQVVSPCRVASLPVAVRGFLTERLGDEELGMADPGQQWDSSCVRPMEGLPGRQLIAAAKAGRNWVVHYREGGVAEMEIAVVLEEDGDTIRQVWRGWCTGDAARRECRDLGR